MSNHRSIRAVSLPARGRAIILASIAVLVVGSFDVRATAVAAPASGKQIASASDDVAFSARARGRSRGNNAAGLAMMGLMVGTIGAVIAAQHRRNAYEDAYNARYRAYPGHPYAGAYGAYPPGPSVGHYHHHYRSAPVVVPQHYGHGGGYGVRAPDGYAGPVKRAY